ncbi:unnamed protein product, partial [Ectocarpus sp. 12 AP-2014]
SAVTSSPSALASSQPPPFFVSAPAPSWLHAAPGERQAGRHSNRSWRSGKTDFHSNNQVSSGLLARLPSRSVGLGHNSKANRRGVQPSGTGRVSRRGGFFGVVPG